MNRVRLNSNRSTFKQAMLSQILLELPRGYFILFDGIDGTGKTSFSKRLWLDLGTFFPTIWSHEPTQSPYGRKLRQSFLTERLSLEEESQLFFQDRFLHVSSLINPCLEKKYLVIMDRYDLSTYAYQMTRGMDSKSIEAVHKDLPKPDLTFVMDAPVDFCMERLQKQRKVLNSMEKRDTLLAAREIFTTYPYPNKWIIDTTHPPKQVYEKILLILFKEIICKNNCPLQKELDSLCLGNNECFNSEIIQEIMTSVKYQIFDDQSVFASSHQSWKNPGKSYHRI